MLSHFCHVWLFVTLWAIAHQDPLSMVFSRQEYWSGLSCPPPRHKVWYSKSKIILQLLRKEKKILIKISCSIRSFTCSIMYIIKTMYDHKEVLSGYIILVVATNHFIHSPSSIHWVQFIHSVLSDSVTPWTAVCPVHHQLLELVQTHQLSQWCHPTISSSVISFSCCLQFYPASGSFPMCQFFIAGGQSIRISGSVSVLPMNIQDWFPLGLIGWISLQSKGLSRVFYNTIVQKHQFFGAQLSL